MPRSCHLNAICSLRYCTQQPTRQSGQQRAAPKPQPSRQQARLTGHALQHDAPDVVQRDRALPILLAPRLPRSKGGQLACGSSRWPERRRG